MRSSDGRPLLAACAVSLALLAVPARADTELGNWMADDVQAPAAAQRPDMAYAPLDFTHVHQTANDVDPEYAGGEQAALIDAARRDDRAEVERLIKLGVNPNARPDLTGKTALMHAIDHCDVTMARQLLDAGADPDQLAGFFTPLGRAAQQGYDRIVSLLLKHGADPDLKSKDGNTPLMAAVSMDRLDSARLLIAARPDYTLFDAHGQTALSLAVTMGRLEMVRLMLEAGVDPNLPNKFGSVPLSMAGGAGNEELQYLLVKHGAEAR